jgi:DNA-binding CsgD family transcriptional regulator
MHHDLHGSRILKPRDEKIIEFVSQGLKNEDIAREIGTTEHVVKNYLRIIYDKVGVWNRLELALWHISRNNTQGLGQRQSALATKDPLNPVDPFRSYRNIPVIKPLILPKKPERAGLA